MVLVWCPLPLCLKQGNTLEARWKGSVKARSRLVVAAQQRKLILTGAQSDLTVLKKSWTSTAIMLPPAVVARSYLKTHLPLLHTCHLASCMTLALSTLGCNKVAFLHPT